MILNMLFKILHEKREFQQSSTLLIIFSQFEYFMILEMVSKIQL